METQGRHEPDASERLRPLGDYFFCAGDVRADESDARERDAELLLRGAKELRDLIDARLSLEDAELVGGDPRRVIGVVRGARFSLRIAGRELPLRRAERE